MSKKHEQYKSEHRREKNKIRKLLKYQKKHPNDKLVAGHIERIKKQI